MDVDTVGNSGFRLAPGDPVTVDVLPSMGVHLDKVQQERVHAAGGKAGHRAPEHRKHPSENTHKDMETGHNGSCLKHTRTWKQVTTGHV